FGRDQNFANSWAAQLFEIRREQGRTAELLPVLEDMLDAAQGVGGMRSIYGLALVDAGDLDGTRAVLDKLLDKGLTNIPRDATYSTVLPNLAELIAATRAPGAADLVYERLLPFQGQLLVAAWGVYC